MIAASEPLEFVPHGRTVLAKHPGQIYGKHNTSASENSLLYKLTNFAIKDESLLLDKEDNEWWCIREVYYRQVEETDEEPIQPKDSKFDYNSESFRPISRLKNDFNLSIKSELMKKVDSEPNSAGPSRTGSANSSSNMSKKFNLNSSGSVGVSDRPLNPKTDCYYEEELYVKGCTAVWSKGLISTPATKLSGPEQRETICCYTIDNPIKHAAFANFHIDIKNTMLIDALNTQIGDVKKNIKIEDTTEHIKSEIMPSIVLLDNKCMRVYAADGREYITSIPFQVKKVWPMKYGVLLEKDATPVSHNSMLTNSFLRFNETNNSFNRSRTNNMFNASGKLRSDSMSGYDTDVPLPTCFSLTHPLDEVTPILMKSPSQGLQYYNDGDLQIIFVSTNPTVVLLYDWKLSIHSLWRIRKATRDECLSMCPNMNTTTFSQTCDYIGSPMHSNRNATSWATGLGSPYQSKKGLNTTPSRSRVNSPMANIFHQQGMSPHASIGQASSTSMMYNTANPTPPALPLYPDICIDHIWTDNTNTRRDPVENYNDLKTFLHTDLVGHDYLCFMVKHNSVSKLQILRLHKSHYHGQASKTNLMVGSVSTVLAKDAVVLPHLKMIALIDEAGNIILQSGNNVVGKVHVGGVLARLIDSPYTKRSTFQSPFPKRSSLLPSRSDTTFDDSALHLLSPVPHTRNEPKETLGLCGVCDAAGSRLSLQFSSGAMYRISLPPLARSALVAGCCNALTAILPKDITMQVIIKWYGVRNSPGTQDLTPQQEWTMFSNLLLSLIGYDTDRLNKQNEEEHTETASKKQRTSSDGTQDDWDYLINSKLHKSIGNSLSTMLKLPSMPTEGKHKQQIEEDDKTGQFNPNSILFPHVLQVLFSLHLLYEEIKLNMLLANDLKPLSTFLFRLAKDLKLDSYLDHYWLDFPTEFNVDSDSEYQISDEMLKKLNEPSYFTKQPPNVFSYFNSMFRDMDVGYYPYLADVNKMSKDLIEVLGLSGVGRCSGVQAVSMGPVTASTPRRASPSILKQTQPVLALVDRGITPRDIANLPPALGLCVQCVCAACRGAAACWPRAAATLLSREDLLLHDQVAHASNNGAEYLESLAFETLEKETAYTMNSCAVEEQHNKTADDGESYTGMEHLNTKLLSLLYPRDHRMAEVVNMLQSSQPVTINLTQRPEVSDHDFIEEQEKYLYALSTRTMALPIGRGMVTVRTLGNTGRSGACVVPHVCVWGRGGGGGGVAAAELGAAALAWPAFHSAVAHTIAHAPAPPAPPHTNNKPKNNSEHTSELAGYLLGLGLNGHLKDMPFMNMYEYLVKCNEMVSIGLLLGLAATYIGTMDMQATKLLSIHVEALLPPTSVELDIQQNILVAALLGVGLLYHDTHHNHYAQVLLNEIGKPGCGWSYGEAEQCVEREGYALAAGLALGWVLVGAGPQAPHHLPHALRTYMLGGDTAPTGGSRGRRPVNLDVTSPGATLALGLVYLKRGPVPAAQWLAPPHTPYDLDYVRPDLLMLRVIARGLILWDDIEASEEWIENQVPETIRPYCFVKPTEDNIDYEAMNQAYCNIVGGAAFAMGIRFAGSGDEDARDAALGTCARLLHVWGSALAELAGRATLEACTTLCLLAAAMIMAGRGDLSVLRVCRRLRARVPPAAHHPPLTYGGQTAVAAATGLLFLGGGRCTLGTSKKAVAALLTAFFPKFPTHSEDNRYHLQAFRHLYVLAVEPRLLLPRDLDTGKLCYAHIQVIDLEGAVKEMKAPCIIPELDTLKEVRINDPRYWPVAFQRDRNWNQLKTFLDYTWCVDIKQRAGCLSYLDDPHGFLTILAQTLTLDNSNVWTAKPDNIHLFTNDDNIRNFLKHYLSQDAVNEDICADCLVISKKRKGVKNEAYFSKGCCCRRYSLEEQEYVQGLSMVTYDCLVKDMLSALPMWVSFLKILRAMKTEPTSQHVWQIKLLLSQIEHQNRRTQTEMNIDDQDNTEPFISSEFTLAIKQKVSHIFDSWEPKLTPFLRKYLGQPSSRKLTNCDDTVKKFLSAFIVYHDLSRNVLKDPSNDDELSMIIGKDMSADALCKLEEMIR